MRLDRSRFLLFTAGLAACGGAKPTEVPTTVLTVPEVSGPPIVTNAPPAPAVESSSEPPHPSREGVGYASDEGGYPSSEGRTSSSGPAIATEPPPSGMGQLSVNCIPSCDIDLDGKRVGTSPIFRLVVAPGSHLLVLSRQGAPQTKKTVTVTVTAGQNTRVAVKLHDPYSSRKE